jgi:NTP pyrophosphatase (non-canonical NTP hydrolase)
MKIHELTLDEYQRRALTTAIYPGRGDSVLYPTIGLAGEVGEVSELVKKAIRDDGGAITDERRERIIGELGDVLWYVAVLADECGATLGDVATRNLTKLSGRMARGTIGGSGEDR